MAVRLCGGDRRGHPAGQQVKQEDLDNLQSILTFLQELDTAEVGTHILEGVGEGMTAAGWDSDAGDGRLQSGVRG